MSKSIPIQTHSIGERIREARKSIGLSQADLAIKVGVSQPAIANWETGVHDPRRIVLAKLADALDAPLEWLAAGARSPKERDSHATAAYIRRLVHHVPVIGFADATAFADDLSADPHAVAQDYIPVTTNASRLFAVLVTDTSVDKAFPPNTIVVIDYGDRVPVDGAFALLESAGSSELRRWDMRRQQYVPWSRDPQWNNHANKTKNIIGSARVSIRFH